MHFISPHRGFQPMPACLVNSFPSVTPSVEFHSIQSEKSLPRASLTASSHPYFGV